MSLICRAFYKLTVDVEVLEVDLDGSVNLVAILNAIEVAVLHIDALDVGWGGRKSINKDSVFAT